MQCALLMHFAPMVNPDNIPHLHLLDRPRFVKGLQKRLFNVLDQSPADSHFLTRITRIEPGLLAGFFLACMLVSFKIPASSYCFLSR